jgi:hypothetical protein
MENECNNQWDGVTRRHGKKEKGPYWALSNGWIKGILNSLGWRGGLGLIALD